MKRPLARVPIPSIILALNYTGLLLAVRQMYADLAAGISAVSWNPARQHQFQPGTERCERVGGDGVVCGLPGTYFGFLLLDAELPDISQKCLRFSS
jgi:hypothetical protein